MRKGLLGALSAAVVGGCVSLSIPSSNGTSSGRDSSILELNRIYRPVKNNLARLSNSNLENTMVAGKRTSEEEIYFSPSSQDLEKISALTSMSYQQLRNARLSPRDVGLFCTQVLTHYGGAYDDDVFKKDFWQSGETTWALGGGDCDDGAVFAAALLESEFKPYILYLYNGYVGCPPHSCAVDCAHAVFAYKTKDNCFGSIGLNKSDVVPPYCDSIREVVNTISKESRINWADYYMFDISQNGTDFISGSENNKPPELN
jgi:hypothetical protein